MSSAVETKGEIRKQNYFGRLKGLLEKYSKILIVQIDNVGSKQMQEIRKSLRDKATVLMGKNTLIRKIIRNLLPEMPHLEPLLPYVKGNVGFVFCDDEISEVRKIIQENKVPAAAKAGAIAPCDVVVPKGNTGLEPTMTSFLQALNIATKINRGAIEILSDVQLIKTGFKVGPSEAALLLKLGIKPFFYGMEISSVYENGFVFPVSILDLTDDDLLKSFHEAVRKIAAVSLRLDYPTLVAVPHKFIDAYKQVVAVALETGYEFPEMMPIKEYLADPSKFAVAAPVEEETKEEEKEEEKAEESEEESDDEMMGDLFG